MLIATWILAVATAVLAISGPVALFVWLGGRRSDRERRQRDHETEAADRILEKVKAEYVTKSGAGGWTFLAGIALFLIWIDRRDFVKRRD